MLPDLLNPSIANVQIIKRLEKIEKKWSADYHSYSYYAVLPYPR